ncbi:glycosyltransferase family 4 protein [Bacillus sp. FDAARGOS_1420]|uniref:glycosyltransferase family 4 protein n=1 Tax=unclassified Bacillus (in: firmicutes) TaxID=185979 RepID=UPI001C5B688F|nr:glycosyltransferase family 4 protein [Bacillus sp. FDAARGOS_1420]MBW3490772.1 glycosyltransferase family 4 protein [Bacillus sp. FDAARGOS_1420]
MKILLATYWSIPHLGGVWNYMDQLRTALESLGHEVDILGYGDENTTIHIINQTFKIAYATLLPSLQVKLNPQDFPHIYQHPIIQYTEFRRAAYEWFLTQLNLEQYDIIHAQDVVSAASFAKNLSNRSTLIATIHGSVAHEIKRQLRTIHLSPTAPIADIYFEQLEHTGATSTAVTITANNWLKNILSGDFNVPSNHIKILQYGFDTIGFLNKLETSTYIPRPENKKVIFFSGRLVEIKGIQYLLPALAQLKTIRNDFVCWIAGTGDEEEALKMTSQQLGLTNDVFFLGRRDDIPSLLSNADIFVQPSLLDNQPLSLIEAQLAGVPSIVSDAGGLPEMVQHGINGFIIPKENSEEMCRYLNILLTNEQYRLQLGANAKTFALAHWDMNTGIEKLLTIYTEVIKNRR